MRPVRLTLEGFRSYRDRATFPFEGRSLVGVVGPTGSGKSSILDAISFAMYGRTPSGAGVKSLIHNRADAARVELFLEIDGTLYRVVRSVRAKGSGGQALERWSELDADRPDEMLTDKAREIGDWFAERLGLDFEAFTRSVLLAQDQFHLLLKGDRRKADEVLAGLFGFGVVERMRDLTKERLTKANAQLELAKKARAELADLAARAEAARSRREAAAARVEELAAVATPLLEVAGRLAEAKEAASSTVARVEELRRALDGLTPLQDVDRVIAEARDHQQLLAAAAAALEDAGTAFAAASKALDDAVEAAVPDRLAGLEAALVGLAADERALAAARAAVDEATSAATEAIAVAGAADRSLSEATESDHEATAAAEAAAVALREVEARHAAHVLAEDLVPGEPCPVCRRPVEDLPDVDDVAGIEALREEASLARERAEAATQARVRAEKHAATATTKAEHAGSVVESARVGLAAVEATVMEARAGIDVLVEGFGGGGAPSEVLASARTDYEGLVAAKKAAAERLSTATEAHTALAGIDVAASLRSVVDAHVAAAGVGGMELATTDDPEAARRLVTDARTALSSALESATDAAGRATEDVERGEAERARLLSSVGLDPDDDHGAVSEAARTELAVATALADQLGDQAAAGERAMAEADETRALALRLERLHADLAPAKFPRYLLDEKRHELAAAGTDWLELLSSGRYAFTVEDDRFKISELTAAGLVRDAETLSGGETFLASLALALGLASMVGLEHGALQAFFIDEGFGSLDADSLDLAMEGIERLVGEDGDRLVVVVSHVPEMRARIEDLIVLSKDPVTGSTSVVRA